jgi:hypothetical protein
MDKSKSELADLGRELRYTQQVVAGELASWQENRVEMGRRALKDLARKMCVVEKARLESMRRAIRGLGIGKDKVHGVDLAAQVASTVIEDVTDELRVEHANPIPRDEEEGQEVVHGNGETVSNESVPADEVEQELQHVEELAADVVDEASQISARDATAVNDANINAGVPKES